MTTILRIIILTLALALAGAVNEIKAAARFAVTSGNWDGAIWAATVNGVAGSAATPTNLDDVTINAAVTVDINVAASANSLTVNGNLNINLGQDITIRNAGSVTINNGSILTFGPAGQIIGGNNNANGIAVTVNAGANLLTEHVSGFNTGTGNTTLTGSIAIRPGNRTQTWAAGINFTYNGTAAQAGGSALINAAGVTIDNTAGVTLSRTLTVTGALTLTSGTLAAGTNLTMAANSSINSAGGSLTGSLQGTNAYDLTFSGNTRTAETTTSSNGGLRNVTVSMTAGNVITLAGNMTPDGNINITTGTMSTSTFTINRSASGGSLTVSAGATLNIGGTNSLPSNYTTFTLSGIVEYSGSGSQTIAARNYTDLVSSGTGARVLANTGTIAISGSFTPGTNSYTTTGSTVNFSNTAGGQSIPALSYNNLTLSNTSNTNTASGNISVAGTFTTSAGGVFDLVANTLTVTTVSSSGTIRTQNTSATPITAAKTWGGTVDFNNSTGGQTIVGGTYTNLTSGNTSGINSAAANLTVNGVLTIAAGGTLNMATFSLAGTGFSNSGTGTLRTQFSAAGAVPSGVTWTCAVEYSRSGNQTVATGSYSTLVTSGSGTKTLAGNTSVTNALTLTAGTLSTSTFTLTLQTTSITNTTGSLNVGSGKVEFNTAGTINLPNSFFSVTPANNVTINGGAVVNLSGTPTQQTIQGILDITNGKLGLAENATLVIAGTVTNMSASNAIVGKSTASIQVIGASATGTLYFDQASPNSSNLVNNFIVSKTALANTVTIGNTFKVRGVLTPTKGTVVSNGNLVIASDINGSGRIYPAIVATDFQFVGDVSVERYVKSKNLRKFVFLSSPVDGVSIRNAWQDDIFVTGPGTGGTPCGAGTGNGGATDKYNTNGFDATIANTVSIYTYDQNNAARWVAVPNTSATLTKGKGYRVLYRGSRGVNDANCSDYLMLNTPSAPSTATMNVAGTPTTGDVFVSIDGPTTGTFGYTLLGNPYACELDFTQFRSQNNSKIAATYWTYDPNGTTSSTSYLTVNNGTVVGGYHSSNDPNDYPNPNFIASGQAFFVQADSDTTLRFTESQKVSQNQAGVFRTANAWNSRIRVHFKQADDAFIDNVVVRFSNDPTVTIAESTEWDASTLNGGTFLATIKGNRSFAIQTRPLNFFNDTVMVRVVSAATGNFKLTFSDYGNFTEAAEIILLDLFAGTQTNVKTNPVYPFTITTSSASQGGRFKLVFRSAASVLPLSFLNISATAKQAGVAVTWKVAFEQGVNKFVVERSRNGHDFEYAGEVASKGNSNVAVDYNFLDANALKGTSYYRVRSVENSGGSYSEVVKVNASKQHNLISLYPNPAKEKLRLTMYDGGNSGGATVRISNAQGKTIIQLTNITTNGYVIDVSNLPNGMYFLSVTGTNGEHMIEKFVKN